MMCKNMHIRRMEEADLPAVAALERKSFSMPWSEQALREAMEKEQYVFVVAEADSVIGYGGMLCILDEADITNIAVDRHWFRRGVGTNLIRALAAAAKERGICAMTLEVRAGNEPAIALYEKMGFQIAGVRKRFYEKPVEDAVIMWKSSL